MTRRIGSIILTLALALSAASESDSALIETGMRRGGLPIDDLGEDRVSVDYGDGGIIFRFFDDDALEARIAGTFNNWGGESWEMRREEGGWVYRTDLDDGDYTFQILYRSGRDGDWLAADSDDGGGWGFHRTQTINIELHGDHIRLRPSSDGNNVLTDIGYAYNRVEGSRFDLTLGYESERKNRPELSWTQGYAFGHERWSWNAGAALPIPGIHGAALGFEGYDHTESFDRWSLTPDENTLAAFFLKEDFFDYVWTRGWAAFARKETDGHEVRIGYRQMDVAPLIQTAEWSMFGKSKSFRPNYFSRSEGVEGEIRKMEGAIVIDRRNYEDNPTAGWILEVDGEYAGEELGGDWNFTRRTATFSHYYKPARDMHLDLRLIGGAVDGDVPLHHLYYLGGVGSMRGHRTKSIVGRRMALANVEFRVAVTNACQIAFFSDIGDAWETPERQEFDPETDMGIGISDEDGSVRVDFARQMKSDSDEDMRVTFRLNRTF